MVVVDPDDYSEVLAKLQSGDGDNSFRRRLAWKAFQHASSYDSAVAEWLWKHQREDGGTLIVSQSHPFLSCGWGLAHRFDGRTLWQQNSMFTIGTV